MLILDEHGSHTDIEFMWLCKQNKIAAIYLPAHTSHVLQPLDLAPFSIIKSSYRHQIQALSTLDDAAPVKKERFISLHYQSRMDGLSERVIRAGWRAAGLCPYNPDQVLRSSQVSARAITPPLAAPPTSISDLSFKTPQRPQDLYPAQQQLLQLEALSRSTRSLFSKAGKAIGAANNQVARLQAANQCLQYQLDQVKGRQIRKRVQVDPNERFSNVEAIKAAVDRAAAQQAAAATMDTEKAAAAAAAAEAAALTLQSMCTQFQL